MMSGNPLSWPQEQCHIIDQLYPYSAVNIIGGVVTIEGIVDLLMRRAINALYLVR